MTTAVMAPYQAPSGQLQAIRLKGARTRDVVDVGDRLSAAGRDQARAVAEREVKVRLGGFDRKDAVREAVVATRCAVAVAVLLEQEAAQGLHVTGRGA